MHLFVVSLPLNGTIQQSEDRPTSWGVTAWWSLSRQVLPVPADGTSNISIKNRFPMFDRFLTDVSLPMYRLLEQKYRFPIFDRYLLAYAPAVGTKISFPDF